MIYLIRNYETGLFFESGGWTDDVRRAQRFSDLDEAIELCRLREFLNVEVRAYKLGEGQQLGGLQGGIRIS